jgi:deoxyadenosine/deoxycytidine kinase
MSNYEKYLKYKEKYINLKKDLENNSNNQLINIPKSLNIFLGGGNINTYNQLFNTLTSKLLKYKNNNKITNLKGGAAGWYLVEGNIGSGKSTLLRKLGELKDTEIIQEPVDKWTHQVKGTELLNEFYKNMDRYTFTFQVVVLQTCLEALNEKPQTEKFRFSERSIWASKEVFAKQAIEGGKMTPLEAYWYEQFFKWVEKSFPKKPLGLIYVDTTPENCYKRIQERGREAEKGIPLDYLKKVHEGHNEWFAKWKAEGNQIPIHRIDNNKDNNYPIVIKQVFDIVNGGIIPDLKVAVVRPELTPKIGSRDWKFHL